MFLLPKRRKKPGGKINKIGFAFDLFQFVVKSHIKARLSDNKKIAQKIVDAEYTVIESKPGQSPS